jgi:hypothetical protein
LSNGLINRLLACGGAPLSALRKQKNGQHRQHGVHDQTCHLITGSGEGCAKAYVEDKQYA